MDAKDKAKELVGKMYQFAPLDEIEFYSNDNMAKQCALIAVDELLNMCSEFTKEYWIEVKQEINKL